jgi:DNA adenine methylase
MNLLKTKYIQSPRFLRYPGGKGRLLPVLSPYLPVAKYIKGRYIDPFVGGASVFFYLRPTRALLSDVNRDLMDLYSTLRSFPQETWVKYAKLPNTKEGYYQIRSLDPKDLDCTERASRLLYLNRTCFKGMWRQNKEGKFNIGYGGESRRWVITENELIEVSKRLRSAEIMCADFETILDDVKSDDFVFLDPPYRPGYRELRNAHYVGQEFSYEDHERLANILRFVTNRRVPWIMTNSAHPDICSLYEGNSIIGMPIGTGAKPGLLSSSGGEVIIYNRYAFDYFSLSAPTIIYDSDHL